MHRPSLLATFVLAVLLASSQLCAATEVPFSFRDGLVWVKVAAPGASAPLNFLLDSGASASVIDLRAARRLGMKSGRPQIVRGIHTRSVAYEWNGFEGTVGGIPLPRQILALDLSAVSHGCHQQIDGLIGADFFRDRIIQLEYGDSCVRIFPRRAAPPVPGTALPIAIRNDAMCVRVSLGAGEGKWTRLDTGCDSDLHWVKGASREESARGASIAATSGSAHQATTEVRLGPEVLPEVETTLHAQPIFSGEAGLVGNGILSRFTVTFDRDGKRLYLDRR